MFMRVIFIIISVCAGIIIQSPLAGAQESLPSNQTTLTLKELFELALKNSERIAISDETVREAQALYRNTLGDSFPSFSYRREISIDGEEDSDHEGMFRLTKTDLTGYRELASLKSSQATVRQREYQRQRIEQLLLQDISLAYYALLLAKENSASTQRLMGLARERLNELNERVRVGRARPVDAIAQEVLMAALESQLEESLRQVEARRDLLAFLIGVPQLDHEISEATVSVATDSLDAYLSQAGNRPDIRSSLENVNVFKGLKQVAFSEYLPSLNFTANSYTDRPQDDEDSEWDVLLSVELPLWDWGARRGSLGAADALVNQAELNLQFNRRQAELEIRNAFRDHQSAQKQLTIQAKSVELARQDYEIQVEDDRQGLVTNLEVFESLDRLNNTELAFNNARLQEKLAIINLAVASGVKPEEILK